MLDLQELLFPKNLKCVWCGREIPAHSRCCDTCAKQEQELLSQGGHDGGIFYCVPYAQPVKRLIARCKYDDSPHLAAYIAALMAQTVRKHNTEFDLITFVPIHEKRKRSRGFDQSELLAYFLSVEMGKPCMRVLERKKNTPPLFDLNAQERKKVLKHAFVCVDPQAVRAKTVLLVDDIATTGTSLESCASLLSAAGAKTVLFAFAREMIFR